MSSPTPHVALDDTLGTLFIGVILAACLYGVSCLQAWYYFTQYNDVVWIKALVWTVMICDTLHQAFICHSIYVLLITNFGVLQHLVWSALASTIVTATTAILVQGFFAVRIWRLSCHNVWLTGLISILSLVGFVVTVTFAAMAIGIHFTGQPRLEALHIMVNVFPTACDVVITAAMCVLLHKSRSGFHPSDIMINKLILFAVNTGLVTSLFAIGSLVSGLAAPKSLISGVFYFPIGRLYTNSLLATLNGREMVRATGSYSSGDIDIPLSTTSRSRIPTGISIRINTQKESATDADSDKGRETATVSKAASTFDSTVNQQGESPMPGYAV